MGDQQGPQPPTNARVRAELEDLVIRDLYGPTGDAEHERHEEITERPTDCYILGRLAPNGTTVDPDGQDSMASSGAEAAGKGDSSGDDTASEEPEAPSAPSMFCSGYGFTACVEPHTTELQARASWAHYGRIRNESGGDRRKQTWRREPHGGTVTVPLTEEGVFGPLVADPEHPEVVVRGRVRTIEGTTLVTVFLVNTQHGENRAQNAWLFQAGLELTAPDERQPVFVPRPENFSGGDDLDQAEQRRLAMAYRFNAEFATGHSVAVAADPVEHDRRRATRVRTQAVPRHEVPFTDVPTAERDPELSGLGALELDMSALSRLPANEVHHALDPLVTSYRAWIRRKREGITADSQYLADYADQARESLDEADRAADRIEQAVDLLASDPQALRCFRFANAAMRLQRLHTLAAAERRRRQHADPGFDAAPDEIAAEFDQPRNYTWRPFQLAFVLLNLPSLTDPAHPERTGPDSQVADLLWFPTGGGKTEAYLGLTAYTLAVRRAQRDEGELSGHSGVAVLMRYTLRLLTLQQFQRATALICACEELRRADETSWGTVPFRIGLWVGAKITPNQTEKVKDWLSERRGARGGWHGNAEGSPHQLVSCPWCGSSLDPGRDISVDSGEQRTRVLCPDLDCPFGAYASRGEGLPVVVVDEEIYRLVPSLLIATVDKFAQLAWQGETQSLFGRASWRCTRHGYLPGELHRTVCGGKVHHQAGQGYAAAEVTDAPALRPPDLVIQDELHLISGPLGSLVGLYETAVDRLASWELPGSGGRTRVRPKVVASTATVRRAGQQIGMLFAGRATRIFPPQGPDADDTFFARQRPTSEVPGRAYLGICAHGVRVRSAQIRVYVAVMGAAQKLHDKYGRNEVTDPYMTLVGYFTSMRDLGGMRRIVEDDVSTRLERANERGLAARRSVKLQELTSRLNADQVRDVLDELEERFPAVKGKRRPLDTLLATSMISVGVDVARLGLMVVNSQPKSAAEYIQATSRVGRSAPGLVFTVYNWARPRDLSHYERFENFHATMYRNVEALSVTPFARRALDRGMMGVLAALVRNLSSEHNPNRAASAFLRDSELADRIREEFRFRAAATSGDQRVVAETDDALNARLDMWQQRNRVESTSLSYRQPRVDGTEIGLLRKPEDGPWTLASCPMSLRDVESNIRLILDPNDRLGEDDAPDFVPWTQSENRT